MADEQTKQVFNEADKMKCIRRKTFSGLCDISSIKIASFSFKQNLINIRTKNNANRYEITKQNP